MYLDGTPSTRGVPVELDIPPYALTEPVTIRITETMIPPPDGVIDWSPLYLFEPADLAFAVPANVRMPWASTSGYTSPGLAIYWSGASDDCALEPLADDYQNAGFNQGSVTRLGWALAAAPGASDCP